MTAQIKDRFRYKGVDFYVSGISEGKLFEPSLLNLKPVRAPTACWRGYQALFAVSGSHLVLDKLHVKLLAEGKGYERQQGPPINGVTPTGPSEQYIDFFNNNYVGLDYHLEYTGGLLLADGFIDALRFHIGVGPAWKYTHVIELIFANGILQQEFDRSERMAEVRQRIIDFRNDNAASRRPSKDEIRDFVERSFDRTYKRMISFLSI